MCLEAEEVDCGVWIAIGDLMHLMQEMIGAFPYTIHSVVHFVHYFVLGDYVELWLL